jgi:hypothetical protein
VAPGNRRGIGAHPNGVTPARAENGTSGTGINVGGDPW